VTEIRADARRLIQQLNDERTSMIERLPIEGIEFESEARCGGVQHVARFPNGYAASVFVCDGDYEVAVMVDNGGRLATTYDTPITNDVVKCLTVGDVARVLLAIKRLPPR
jgi:hypothetical protein